MHHTSTIPSEPVNAAAFSQATPGQGQEFQAMTDMNLGQDRGSADSGRNSSLPVQVADDFHHPN
jgi:hypothetical protein